MDFPGCLNDEALEPTVVGCRGDFDFTIKFEKIFFSLIPSTLFIVACAPRLALLWHRKALVGGKLLCCVKLATLSLLSALQLTLLVLSIVNAGAYKSYFVSASALALVSGLGLIILSLLEHARSPRPSILISFYLALTLLLDVAQTRTLWLASRNQTEATFCRVYTSALALKGISLLLESQNKTRWIAWDTKEHSPEETSGLFGLGAFIWLNRLFLSGYAKVLKVGDLYPLDPAMCAGTLDQRLARHWQNSESASRSKYGLARALMKALAVPILLPVVPRAAMAAFQFCQSFLINALLNYLEEPKPSKNVGYGLIGATILIYLGIAVTFALYWYYQERAIYMARGALVGAIYKKTTEVGLPAADNSALTLMSGDIERIIAGFLNIHELWANTAQVAIACWLLSQQIGLAFLAPLIVVGVFAVCSTILARLTGPRQKVWMEEIQKRVGLTSTVVGQMKNLKMSGLAAPVGKLIQQMRIDELRAGARFRMILSFTATLGVTPLSISPVMAFAFASRTLGVTTIFTSMSYIVLLATPLSVLFQSIPTLMAALTCLDRIQVFLESDARRDFRVATSSPKRDGTSTGESPTGNSKGKSTAQPTYAIEISGGSFAWKPDRQVLSSIDLKIPSAALTIIIGPVASGKSTLCKALLGETSVAHGTTRTGFSPGLTRVGYCDQAPYLSTATIRENIVGFSEFEKDRYDEAVEAAMLRHDLDVLLPEGNHTQIGTDGITLSGGQKQRVCLARAPYHDTHVVICDDVLRGLDADMEDNVFRKVFSTNGVLRRRKATVILSTHSVRYLPFADHIIALNENGTISEKGTFQELVANRGYVYGLNVEHRTDQHSVDGESLPTDATKPAEKLNTAAAIAHKDANMSEDEHSRMFGDVQVYKHYFARIGISSQLAFLVSAVAWGFFYSFPTVWLTLWSDDITSAHPDHSNSFFLGLYALFQICTPISLLFMSLICFRTMVHQSGSRIHQDALNTVISAPLRFFSRTDTGTITNFFS
ncbi:hypothetical protein INS49_003314 [Diaporthe citri]|uniref:uncharacterized protein n=1 Tax=Diaporthe citri TaxID=83186 RepID=UPI001C80747F|nr:uncharacterized protein INS49_003314 [Diaporthe citri]KAG6355352.1 hypothetical protein INS49_003314 [Diaporthe citri]